MSATSETIFVDEEVYVLVDLKENAGFGALQFCITYDKDKLLLENASTGELIPNTALSSINTDILGEINFSMISTQNITDSGTVLVSKFKAKDAGAVKLDFKLLAYADSYGTSLDAISNDVEISVKSNSPIDDSATDNNPPSETSPEGDTNQSSPTSPGESSSQSRPAIHGGSNSGSSTPVDSSGKTETPEPKPTEQSKPPLKDTISFNDVPQSYWAYSYIHKAAELGLFGGTGENTFSPEQPMTRAMFVTVLHRYAGSPKAKKAGFSDLEDSWYTDAVSWAAQNKIVSGTGDNKFSPNDYITRGEISTILCRYKDGKSMDASLADSFKDSDTIPDWGKEPIAWAVEKGLIMGREGGLIAFSDNATRAEAAVIFTRFLNIK